MGLLKEQLKRIPDLVKRDGRNAFVILASISEEVGEVSRALLTEHGFKDELLAESAKDETIDVIIAALALYFDRGGKIRDIAERMHFKLDKWENKLIEEEEKDS